MTDLELLCLRLVRCLGPVKITELWRAVDKAHSGKVIFHTLCGLRSRFLVECDKEMEWFDVTPKGRARFDATIDKRRKRLSCAADLAGDAATVELLKRRQVTWGPVE